MMADRTANLRVDPKRIFRVGQESGRYGAMSAIIFHALHTTRCLFPQLEVEFYAVQ